MSNITNYHELLLEKQRLNLLLTERKILLKTEFEEVKEKLKPFSQIIGFVGKLTSKGSGNPLLNAGITIGVNLLLKKVLLRNAGWVIRLLMPAMVKNYLSHEAEETNNVFAKIGGFFKKRFKQHQQV
jgi:hypothetical protein